MITPICDFHKDVRINLLKSRTQHAPDYVVQALVALILTGSIRGDAHWVNGKLFAQRIVYTRSIQWSGKFLIFNHLQTSVQCGPVQEKSQRSTRSVTLRAANAKLTAATSGRPATATVGTSSRGGRVSFPPSTRPKTATTSGGRGGGPIRRPATTSTTSQSGGAVSQGNLTPRRLAGSLPTSPLVRVSKTAGRCAIPMV